MEIKGRITDILEVETGKSAKGTWKKQMFVIETSEKYHKVYPFEVFGEDAVLTLMPKLAIGSIVTVHFNIKANKWKEKYFIALGAWKIEVNDVEKKESAPAVEGEPDDLPF